MDLRRYFPHGEGVRRFPARGPVSSVGHGIPRCPGVCAWIPGLVVQLRVIPVGCAWNFLPHGRRCVGFLSGSRAPLSRRAMRQSSGRTTGVRSIFSLRGRAASFRVGMR
ncbi:hypothetical protein NDU88_010637 [Pleurodeles waltl]|uniref:Uncharacterized protein n=1 Tax=Pleurodeles waltl TaxID=8319 RepID=A0AAV7PYH8_PLEWA|nr:hypothetical protein NDU88_010637 [Pleurodeles waltl]